MEKGTVPGTGILTTKYSVAKLAKMEPELTIASTASEPK